MKSSTAKHLGGLNLDIAAVIALAALTGIAYLVIIQPMARRQNEIAHLRSQLSTTQSQVAAAGASRAALDERLNRIQGEIEVSPVNLEPVVHLNRRIARIVELASNSGMIIHETRSGGTIDGTLYWTVPVEISGSGAYSNCAAFLHRLHGSLPDTGVVEFELTGHPADRRSPASFRFNLVWYAEPASAGVP